MNRSAIRARCVGLFAVALSVSVLSPSPAAAARADRKPRPVEVHARIIGRVPLERLSTIGMNHESYLFQVADPGKKVPDEFIKVSYRFFHRDSRMSPALLDYTLLHKFRMTRDPGCDEEWETMSTRYQFDKSGRFLGMQDAVVYTQNAPQAQTLVSSQTLLHCYMVRPLDYKSSVLRPQSNKANDAGRRGNKESLGHTLAMR